jgi:hypothetical protein
MEESELVVHKLARLVLANFKLKLIDDEIVLTSVTRDAQGWVLEPVAGDAELNGLCVSIYAGETPILEYGDS